MRHNDSDLSKSELKPAVSRSSARAESIRLSRKFLSGAPLEGLSALQFERVDSLRQSVEADIKDSAALQHFVSTSCLVRYLRARSWKLKDATKMLHATIAWRKQYKPEEISWNDIESEAATGKQYLLPDLETGGHAKDRAGRPVLIMRPRCENTKDYEKQMKFVVYHLESSSWLADKSATSDARMCWIVDFMGYSYANSPPLKQAMHFLSIMQNHYPERLGVAIAYRAPRIFSFMWKGLQPVMDPITRSKVVFIEGKPETMQQQLSKLIDTSYLDTSISGTSPYVFDVKEYEQVSSYEPLPDTCNSP